MRITRISLVLASALIACSTTSERPPGAVLPPSSGELAFREAPPLGPTTGDMAYHEAVDLGSKYVINRGYADAEFQGANQRLNTNLWEVHYGLSPEGKLDLYFDGTNRRLIKAEKQAGVSGALIPSGP